MFNILTSVHNKPWCIDPSRHDELKLFVTNFLNGNIQNIDNSEDRKKNQPYTLSVSSAVANPRSKENEQVIQVLPIFGIISLEDQFCGPSGTLTKEKELQKAGKDGCIMGVILHIESPGGDAHAMFHFTNAIKEFKQKYGKPVGAFVQSEACSAAFGIASVCDFIIASDTHSLVGSIGTYFTVMDMEKTAENQGYIIKVIYAEDSTEKNIESRAAVEGDEKPALRTLKQYNDRFKSIVKEGIPNIKSTDTINPFTGKTIFAKDAIELNMVSEIGNMDVAVNKIVELVNKKSNYSQIHNEQMKFSFKSAWAAIAGLFESKAEGDEMTEADVDKINNELLTRQQKITDLTTQLSAKEAEISELQSGNNTLQAALTETQTQLDAVNTKLSTTSAEVERLTAELANANEELTKRPGTTATTANVETEKIETGEEVKYDAVNDYVKNLNQ